MKQKVYLPSSAKSLESFHCLFVRHKSRVQNPPTSFPRWSAFPPWRGDPTKVLERPGSFWGLWARRWSCFRPETSEKAGSSWRGRPGRTRTCRRARPSFPPSQSGCQTGQSKLDFKRKLIISHLLWGLYQKAKFEKDVIEWLIEFISMFKHF